MTQYTKNRIKEILSNGVFASIFIIIFLAVIYFVDCFMVPYVTFPLSAQDLFIYSGVIFLLGTVCGRYIQKFVGLYNITQGIKALTSEYEASVHLLGLLNHIKSKGWNKMWSKMIEQFYKGEGGK